MNERERQLGAAIGPLGSILGAGAPCALSEKTPTASPLRRIPERSKR